MDWSWANGWLVFVVCLIVIALFAIIMHFTGANSVIKDVSVPKVYGSDFGTGLLVFTYAVPITALCIAGALKHQQALTAKESQP